MRVIEITEDGKEILCEKLKKAKDAIDELEHELKESFMDTRMGYPRYYDNREYKERDRERDTRGRYGY